MSDHEPGELSVRDRSLKYGLQRPSYAQTLVFTTPDGVLAAGFLMTGRETRGRV